MPSIRAQAGPAPQPAAQSAGDATSDVELATIDISLGRRLKGSASLGVLLVIVLFTLLGLTQSDQFVNGGTWVNILRSGSFMAIVACAEAMVMISGGLDLSVGSVFSAGVMSATALSFNGYSDLTAFAAAGGIGLCVGLLNGFIINYLDISPIITTLGTMFAVKAVVVTVTQGQPIGPLPDSFNSIGGGDFGPIPHVIAFAVIVAVAAHVLMEYTTIGTAIRAVGGNRTAARALGINTKVVSTAVYALCGLVAALAGVLQASYLGAGDPTLGTGLEFSVIAASIIGGVSIFGALGTITGVTLGAVLLSLLTTGLILTHVDAAMQNFAVGVVLIVAAGVDRLRRNRMFRSTPAGARRADTGLVARLRRLASARAGEGE